MDKLKCCSWYVKHIAGIHEKYRLEESEVLQQFGIELAPGKRVYLRAGYTEDEFSMNSLDGKPELGVSVFEAIFDPTVNGWCPEDPLASDVSGAFESCRTYYLVTGPDVVIDGREQASRTCGKILKQPLKYLAVVRHSGQGRSFVISSVNSASPQEFEAAKQRDMNCLNVQRKCVDALGAYEGEKMTEFAKTSEGRQMRDDCVECLRQLTWDRKW